MLYGNELMLKASSKRQIMLQNYKFIASIDIE